MKIMIRSTSIRAFAVLAALALSLAAISLHAQDTKRGRKYKAPPPTSRIEITILRDSTGKPIENASVIFHPLDENGHDAGNMELKTNEDGKTIIDVIETGATLRVQVIAKGFQTYGKDYKIDQSTMAFDIRMKRPGEQYSTYKPHPEQDQNPDQKPDQKPQQ
jgi:hypothetical protein